MQLLCDIQVRMLKLTGFFSRTFGKVGDGTRPSSFILLSNGTPVVFDIFYHNEKLITSLVAQHYYG